MTIFIRKSAYRWALLLVVLTVTATSLLQVATIKPAFASYMNTYGWPSAPCAASGSNLGKTSGTGYWCSGYNWGESPCPSGDGFCTSSWLMNGYYLLDQWGEGFRNCVSYTAWMLHQQFGVNPSSWGNGKDWNNSALAAGYSDDSSPQVGDIAEWDATQQNSFGHVAYVYAVSNGIASYAEYNYGTDGNYLNSYTSASGSQGAPTHWIHIGTVTPPPPPPAHWIGLAGDWTHKGYDSIGLFNPNTNIFYLRNSNTPGDADTTVAYGNHGWLPIVGDWDGNGTDTVGLYDPTTATFYLRNSNTAGNADVPPFTFGSGGNWVPLVGDWDGNGTTTVGVYDPTTARFYLRNSNNAGDWDYSAVLGNGGSWIPIVGDWDGNGSTTIGVDNTASTFYLSNSNTSGIADVPAFTYANSVWLPVMGNWDGNGNTTTTVGVYDHAGSTFYLRNSNTTGNADITVPYGNPN